jgi:hypothetical protein
VHTPISPCKEETQDAGEHNSENVNSCRFEVGELRGGRLSVIGRLPRCILMQSSTTDSFYSPSFPLDVGEGIVASNTLYQWGFVEDYGTDDRL